MIADLIVSLARNAARAYAAEREEPEYAGDTLSRAIWFEYQRIRADERERELREYEAMI